MVEPADGSLLRSSSVSDVDLDGQDSALFRYLSAGKHSIIGTPGQAQTWAAGSDILVEDQGFSDTEIERLRIESPQLVVVSISPFGRGSGWDDRAATEFTLQAMCGTMKDRGEPDRPPLQAGGRLGEWATGAYAAVGGLAAFYGARRSGRGEHVDVSMLEVMVRTFRPGGLVERDLGGIDPGRNTIVPSILPTADGWVGVQLMTRQHFDDFVALIGQPELIETELWRRQVRFQRRHEFLELVHNWSRAHTAEEILELFTAVNIPVTALGDGAAFPEFDHSKQRGMFIRNPSGGFLQPRPPIVVNEQSRREVGKAPRLGDLGTSPKWADREIHRRLGSALAGEGVVAPLDGLRVLDLTGYWAGPDGVDLLAALGADVIKVESPFRPDPHRANTIQPDQVRWWEYSPNFHAINRNKRGIALDLRQAAGLEVFKRLLRDADVMIDNFRPAVLDRLGLSYADVQGLAPLVVVVRMPGFGLTGPWRDRGAFGPTIEQVCGMAFTTGYSADEPIVPGGLCDPIQGSHAAFATLLALVERDRSGAGSLVEVPMLEVGANVSAEVVIEYSAYGHRMVPRGNRGPDASPQGVYRCLGADSWIAIAVQTDDQWQALCEVTGLEGLRAFHASDLKSRREHEEGIDAALKTWSEVQTCAGAVESLSARSIPAAEVMSSYEIDSLPPLVRRRFFEIVSHQESGSELQAGIAFRFVSSGEGWLKRAAPTLGQHNREVLEEFGYHSSEIDELYRESVLGDSWLERSGGASS